MLNLKSKKKSKKQSSIHSRKTRRNNANKTRRNNSSKTRRNNARKTRINNARKTMIGGANFCDGLIIKKPEGVANENKSNAEEAEAVAATAEAVAAEAAAAEAVAAEAVAAVLLRKKAEEEELLRKKEEEAKAAAVTAEAKAKEEEAKAAATAAKAENATQGNYNQLAKNTKTMMNELEKLQEEYRQEKEKKKAEEEEEIATEQRYQNIANNIAKITQPKPNEINTNLEKENLLKQQKQAEQNMASRLANSLAKKVSSTLVSTAITNAKKNNKKSKKSNAEAAKAEAKIQKAKEKIDIKHIWFTAWTDHGVPDIGVFDKFVKNIKTDIEKDNEGEGTLIHCSAGVGRTGVTYVVLYLLFQGKTYEECVKIVSKEDQINNIVTPEEQKQLNDFEEEILSVVESAKKHRHPYTVQTTDQYIFICNYFGIYKPILIEKFNELTIAVQIADNTITLDCKSGTYNRYGNILPSNRVVLPELTDGKKQKITCSDYINASTMEPFQNSEGKKFNVFTASCPILETYKQFYRMLEHTKIKRIIMVTGLYEGGRKKCNSYMSMTNKNNEETFPDEEGKGPVVITDLILNVSKPNKLSLTINPVQENLQATNLTIIGL